MRGRVLAFTGAGISAASGLPTFTGAGGLYEGLNPYELATAEAFRARPVTVWNWYLMRIHSGKDAEPNAAHRALVHLEAIAARLTIVTSNVDGLHDRAGSSRVFRLHGNILETLCPGCRQIAPLDLPTLPASVDEASLPTCSCGATLRPNVVWFGEYPAAEALNAVRQELPDAHVVLEIGHSGLVSYGFTEAAIELGIPVVRINPDGDVGDGVTLLREPAEAAMPKLIEALKT